MTTLTALTQHFALLKTACTVYTRPSASPAILQGKKSKQNSGTSTLAQPQPVGVATPLLGVYDILIFSIGP